ncbi:MAG: hypothetical protein J0I47_09275 [Sphingomonas sp.]|uniref:hypothetical protein n=1 Tax=Sphingomonas sp. TaxID=28214 RepID=UPI001AD4A0C7|nr:hypothetical protein [Sphingomonas sp.]MBN8808410.1 hypothetical protein [Sphingomonas sp.]
MIHDELDTRLFRASPNWMEQMLGVDASDTDGVLAALTERFSHEQLLDGARDVLRAGSEWRASFLLAGAKGKYPILMAADLLSPSARRSLLVDIIVSDSLYVPFPLRAAAGAALQSDDLGDRITTDALRGCANAASRRRYKDLSASPSNDIDHDFEIPDRRDERSALLLESARTAMVRDRATVCRRLLDLGEDHPPITESCAPKHAYVPRNADELFASFTAPGLRWPDFVIEWNEILTETPLEQYTTAEVLRLLLLDPEYHLPGRRQRAVADAVHLNLLRTFPGATIGLRAGVLFVEHGFTPEASFFILGEGAIVGKACVLDGTGVVVVEDGAFLGGGLSPMLIHTHRHVAGGGSRERKMVKAAGFRAARASRLPMDFVGLLEVDQLDSDRWPGLANIPVVAVSRESLWGSTPA